MVKTTPYTNIRVKRETVTKLRLIAAMLGKSMLAVIDELATAKLAELKAKEQRHE